MLILLSVALASLLGSSSAPSAYAAESSAKSSQDPVLVLHVGSVTRTFKRSELLKRADVTAIHVEHDPAYDGKPWDYPHAVPFRSLFEGAPIADGAIVQFECLDGFSAPLSKERLLGTGKADGAIPYLAMEGPGEKWPLVVNSSKTPAPFYLIWKDPAKSNIGTQEWPFQLAGFTVKDSLEATSPQIFPDHSVRENSPIRQGLKVFVKNCFACHTLNLAGQSRLGPDLNVPMNATEYLSEANLKKLIRNPQNLRSWPEAKMLGFNEAALPDSELSQLLAYLKHMSKHKVAVPAKK